jgi:hypothetical protein
MDTSDFTRFIIPLIISNVIGLLLLVTCWKSPRIGRLLMFILFIWAGITNWRTATNSPEDYLDYGNYTFIPLYREFINGWFSHHIVLMVGFIATCQLIIGLSMLSRGFVFKLGAIGGMIFLVCIIPLGISSGFPFPIIGTLAFYFLFRKPSVAYLWIKKPDVSISNRPT